LIASKFRWESERTEAVRKQGLKSGNKGTRVCNEMGYGIVDVKRNSEIRFKEFCK